MKPSSRADPQPETFSEEETLKTRQPPLSPNQVIPPPVHQSDADEEDENVKQLGDCSTLYLALQVSMYIDTKVEISYPLPFIANQ